MKKGQATKDIFRFFRLLGSIHVWLMMSLATIVFLWSLLIWAGRGWRMNDLQTSLMILGFLVFVFFLHKFNVAWSRSRENKLSTLRRQATPEEIEEARRMLYGDKET
jgi:hypothetical protein